MKHGRLIALAGAAIVASSSSPLLLAGAPAASAATAPAATSPIPVTVPLTGGCTFKVKVSEDHDSSGAFVDVLVVSNPCRVGIEAAIESFDGTSFSYGADVTNPGVESVTGPIPVNSSNSHGFRYWFNGHWFPYWVD